MKLMNLVCHGVVMRLGLGPDVTTSDPEFLRCLAIATKFAISQKKKCSCDIAKNFAIVLTLPCAVPDPSREQLAEQVS